MSVLLLGGSRLYYHARGAGEAVVFLHGFSLDHRLWTDQVAALQAGWHCVVYDLRGFGQSSPPAGPFRHVDDLAALLDHLGLRRAHIVGLSLGGGVAVDFCLAYAERVHTLTLVDATLAGFTWTKDWSPPGRAARAHGVAAAREVWLADELFAPALRQPLAAARLRQMVQDYSGWHWLNRSPETALAGAPANERLAEIQAPALVITGEQDVPDFQRAADHLAAGLAGARRETVAGAGHLPNLEAPERFNHLLADFLRRPVKG